MLVCVSLSMCSDQVQSYLQECERRAAVRIQSAWRGFRVRRRYWATLRHALRETHVQQHAARTLQRAVYTHTTTHSPTHTHIQLGLSGGLQVRHFLQRRRTAKTPSVGHFWIGQKGLTDSRRAELKEQVEKYISLHRVRNSSDSIDV